MTPVLEVETMDGRSVAVVVSTILTPSLRLSVGCDGSDLLHCYDLRLESREPEVCGLSSVYQSEGTVCKT